MFWDDGTLSGEGKDEQGDYTISGKFYVFLGGYLKKDTSQNYMFLRQHKRDSGTRETRTKEWLAETKAVLS